VSIFSLKSTQAEVNYESAEAAIVPDLQEEARLAGR